MKKNLGFNCGIILYLLFIFFSGLTHFTNAQINRHRCGTMEYMDALKARDPQLEDRLRKSEHTIQQWLKDNPDWNSRKAQTEFTIPVVVHIVYNTTAQNISDAQVYSQIDVLNEDFARLNADTNLTPAPFATIASAAPYRFCLAKRDPFGNPTTGIERRQTTVTSFSSSSDNIKRYANGGMNAWDVTKYLNIWVGNLSGGTLGYAEFPTSTPSTTFGVAIAYDAFGRNGSAASPYHLGRTATHEIGHCMNLRHIWGDDGTACSGSDNCNDTPNQAGATSSCFTFPKFDSCTPSGNGIMFMNYMDYSYDNCLNIFTTDQVARMIASVNSFYPSLLVSDGCQPVSTQIYDAGIPAINYPGSAICDSVFRPELLIRNWGSDTLRLLNIHYSLDGGPATTVFWTGVLAPGDSIPALLPFVNLTSGNHSLTVYSSLPNGNPDINASNDSSSVSFTIFGNVGLNLPHTEDFENGFPPAGYRVINADAGMTWMSTGNAYHSSITSVYIDNFNYNNNGSRDHLILPPVNLQSISDPALSFWLAYAHFADSSGTRTDSMEVSISVDCGNTWTTLLLEGGQNLNTRNGGGSLNNNFIPGMSDWKRFAISLQAYSSETSAMFRFTNINGHGNGMYLDDINVDFNTGIQSGQTDHSMVLFPNPAYGFVNIRIPDTGKGLNKVRLIYYNSQIVTDREYKEADIRLDLSNFSTGLYLLEVFNDKGVWRSSLLIKK